MTPRTVVFKPSFIKHALYQYLQAGKAHVEIFREVGIDVEVLVKEGLKTAFGNWLTKHKRGIPIGMQPVKAAYDYHVYPKGAEQSPL